MLCVNMQSTLHYYGTARYSINMYTVHTFTPSHSSQTSTGNHYVQYMNEKICDYLLFQKWAYMTSEQKQTSSTDRDHIFMFQAVLYENW
jgi:hypothetical protein